MIDFRYHALSLVAVFLALGIGIVLGVTVGDSLVSDADRNLRDSLRGDVEEAREQARDQEALGERRDDVIEEMAPGVAEGRLQGRRIGLVAFGELPGSVSDAVEESIELGGGRLVRTAIVWPDIGDLLVPLRRPPRIRGRARTLRWLPGRLAQLVEQGGPEARRLGRRASRLFSGSFRGPVDAVVLYRHPPDEPESPDAEEGASLETRERFEDRVIGGLRASLAGVEMGETDPSQVEWYEQQAVPSVDNIETAAGRLALVLVLAGVEPEGAYGYKDSADAAIPDLSD